MEKEKRREVVFVFEPGLRARYFCINDKEEREDLDMNMERHISTQ